MSRIISEFWCVMSSLCVYFNDSFGSSVDQIERGINNMRIILTCVRMMASHDRSCLNRKRK